ncbi:Rossmann-like domain-containing protein [Ferrimonas senticii]|uniref:Rossmann-like domain-containing protein n=1 Tax=Ferrimonas senticii TaxID=394566 RepID=UPI0012EC7020|nr:DUF364 domain-containing protein [Ferrimonas senticii]
MTSIYQTLLAQAPQDLPNVKAIHIAKDDNPNAKFAAIELDDGTIGLTYTKLGGAFAKLQDENLYQAFIGKSVRELAAISDSEQDWQQVIGAGAINAISQLMLKQRGFHYAKAEDTLAMLNIQPGEQVGMVGFFAPLVEQLRADGIKVTVIELRQDLVQQADNFEVTTDASKLSQCDKVLITGTTLINHTIDGLLAHCGNAKEIAVVGPSVGILPELLFDKGITIVGGRAVINGALFMQRWRSGDKWKESVVRYSLTKADYRV